MLRLLKPQGFQEGFCRWVESLHAGLGPKLLDLKGAVVTIDAMGCPREIAREVMASGSDYVLAVKENQPKLAQVLRECFDGWHEEDFRKGDCQRSKTREKGHGRAEERYYYQAPLPESLRPFVKDWEGPATIGQAISITEREGKQSSEVRYYISPPRRASGGE